MLTEQLSLLSPVVAVLLLLCVLVLYVHYTSDREYRIKLLLGPALLAACVFTAPSIGARLGYGWPAPLPPDFQYLAHRTVVMEGQKRWMDVLLLSRKPLDTQARLLRVRWTRELEGVMEEAQRLKEGPEGGEVRVTGPGRVPGGGDDRSGGHSAIRVLPADRMPKDGIPAPATPPGERPRPHRDPYGRTA